MKKSLEYVSLIVLLSLGLAMRLIYISKFPTIPVSDFQSLIYFGQVLKQHGLISNGWFWEYANSGVPLILCGLFHCFPGVPANDLARLATAFVCGALPVIPFLVWRGVLPLWLRFAVAATLALWPGQILFSGVVAQDNWLLAPTVALGALAVRSYLGRPAPISAGLVYALAVAIRQEMMVALVPLFLVAAIGTFRPRWRTIVVASLSAGLPLLASAAYRKAATGRFALTTEHGGLTILGAYVPGASEYGWIDPFPFIASARPDLLFDDRKVLLTGTTALALQEIRRRPAFQMARMASSILANASEAESSSLFWALSPAVLPAARGRYGAALIERLNLPLRVELAGINGMFLAAILLAIRRRLVVVFPLACAIALKYGIHAVISALGRHFFAATALEIMVIWVVVYELTGLGLRAALARVAILLALTAVFGGILIISANTVSDFVRLHDVDSQQRTYRFPLVENDHGAALSCVMKEGLLNALIVPVGSVQSATIQTLHPNPAPEEKAVVECELTGLGSPRHTILQVLDSYSQGGLGGRMIQRVTLDGKEVFSHDIALEPGTGWADIPLGDVGVGTKAVVKVEVKAIHPDAGWSWGDAGRTTFRLAHMN